MDSIRKKAKKAHKKDALKDMVPPQGPLSDLMEGSRDIDELFRDSIKKVHEKKKENETDT